MKPGSYLKLTNAKIDMVRSTMRLAVNNFGKIVELADGTSFEPKVTLFYGHCSVAPAFALNLYSDGKKKNLRMPSMYLMHHLVTFCSCRPTTICL